MNVFIAVDESKIAEKAFEWYMENLHHPDNQVTVFYHTEPLTHSSSQAVVSSDATIMNLDLKSAECSLKYKSKLNELKCKNGKFLLDNTSSGKSGQVILKVAEQRNAQMIIMGTRGMGVVKRTLRGSVSDHVIHNSKVPVIVCPMTWTFNNQPSFLQR